MSARPVSCPHCRARVRVPMSVVLFRCPKCARDVEIPEPPVRASSPQIELVPVPPPVRQEPPPSVQFATEEDRAPLIRSQGRPYRSGYDRGYDRPYHDPTPGRNGCGIVGLFFGCLSVIIFFFAPAGIAFIAAGVVAVLGLLFSVIGAGGSWGALGVAGTILNLLVILTGAGFLALIASSERAERRAAPRRSLAPPAQRMWEDAEPARQKVRDAFRGDD